MGYFPQWRDNSWAKFSNGRRHIRSVREWQTEVMQWWFCLIHQSVEQGAGCPDASRLGPYESSEQAQGVLDRMRQRDDAADGEDD